MTLVVKLFLLFFSDVMMSNVVEVDDVIENDCDCDGNELCILLNLCVAVVYLIQSLRR